MGHIHKEIDFTVCVYIVHNNKVLLIHHKGLNKWLPIGGHIELDEDPEEALYREVKEECGLDITLLGEKPPFSQDVKMLIPPIFMDIHPINDVHRHIGMVYFAKANSDKVTLAADEHHQIKWLSERDITNTKYNLLPNIQFYAKEALKRAK